jgi:hypothetical protein
MLLGGPQNTIKSHLVLVVGRIRNRTEPVPEHLVTFGPKEPVPDPK